MRPSVCRVKTKRARRKCLPRERRTSRGPTHLNPGPHLRIHQQPQQVAT